MKPHVKPAGTLSNRDTHRISDFANEIQRLIEPFGSYIQKSESIDAQLQQTIHTMVVTYLRQYSAHLVAAAYKQIFPNCTILSC